MVYWTRSILTIVCVVTLLEAARDYRLANLHPALGGYKGNPFNHAVYNCVYTRLLFCDPSDDNSASCWKVANDPHMCVRSSKTTPGEVDYIGEEHLDSVNPSHRAFAVIHAIALCMLLIDKFEGRNEGLMWWCCGCGSPTVLMAFMMMTVAWSMRASYTAIG